VLGSGLSVRLLRTQDHKKKAEQRKEFGRPWSITGLKGEKACRKSKSIEFYLKN
jgi:hypothetical protein